jgi:hypothetical protein
LTLVKARRPASRERAGSCPRHALKESASVNLILIMIVKNLVFRFIVHSCLHHIQHHELLSNLSGRERREVGYAQGAPRRSRTCFASPDRIAGEPIPLLRDFYFLREFALRE